MANFPATPVLDDFDRADEGPPPSASWVSAGLDGGLQVISNTCGTTGTITSGYTSSWNTSFGADSEAHCQWAVIPGANGNGMSLLCRLQTSTDYNSDHYENYFVQTAGNDDVQVFKIVSSVLTQLGADIDVGGVYAAGDQLGIRCLASDIEVWYKGVRIDTRTDTDIAAGGFINAYVDNAVMRIDNFGGGTSAYGGPIDGGPQTGHRHAHESPKAARLYAAAGREFVVAP